MGPESTLNTKQPEQGRIIGIPKTAVVSAAGGVVSKVDTVLGNISILEIFKKYPFIKNIDGKVVADFSIETKNRKTSLLRFLEDLFKSGFYIKDLSTTFNVNDIFEKSINDGDKIILGTGCLEIDDRELYFVPLASKDKETRTYHFNKFVDNVGILGVDMDKFIANLYRAGIRYGYNLAKIEEGFQHLKGKNILSNTVVIIADASKAIHGINAKLLGISPKINTDTRSKDILAFGVDTQKQIDTRTYVNTTFDVEKGELLHIKVPLKKRKHGFKVNGERIRANEGIDKENLEEKFLEGFEIENIPGKKLMELLISDDKNYESEKVAQIISDILYVENESIRKLIQKVVSDNFGRNGVQVLSAILKKLNIDPETIVNVDVIKSAIDGTYQAKDKTNKSFVILETLEKTIIDNNSGNIHKILPDKEFIITGEEDKDIKGLIKGIEKGWKISGEYKKLTVNGNVYGDIYVSGETEVVIEGNLSGGSKLIHEGTGKITIIGMISADALVNAKNAEVHIGNLSNGTVLAKNLYIDNLSQGNIVAKKIDIKNIKNRDNSKLTIIGESINIKNLENNGICKAIVLSETISPAKLNHIKRAAHLEIQTEDTKIEAILQSPELKAYYEKIKAHKHDFSIINKLILQIIKSKETIIELVKNQLAGIKNSPELDEKIAILISRSTVQGSDVIKKNALRNRTMQYSHKLKSYLVQLEEHIKKVNEKTELIKNLSSNISNANLSLEHYLGGNTIELYNYEYISELGDIFVDIDEKELHSLIHGTKVPDEIKYKKISGVLVSSNFNWKSNPEN